MGQRDQGKNLRKLVAWSEQEDHWKDPTLEKRAIRLGGGIVNENVFSETLANIIVMSKIIFDQDLKELTSSKRQKISKMHYIDRALL